MRRISAVFLSLVLTLGLSACGGADAGGAEDYYRLSFSMHTAADTPIGRQFQAMFDDIEEKTDGHVSITLFGSGTLSAAADVAHMVSDGACDIGWLFTPFYYGQYPLTDVVTIPGQGVQSCAQGTQVLWNLYDEYEAMREEWSDYHVLLMFPNPVNYVYTNTEPQSLADLSGMSIRSPSGGVAECLRSLGCNVISMAPNDIYDGISKNNIQGYVLEPTGVSDYSLGEVTDAVVDLELYQAPFITIMNKDVYNALPPEYQAVLDEWTGVDASLKFAQMWDQVAQENMDALLESGCKKVAFSAEDHARFQTIADQYVDTWVAQYSTDSFDAGAYYAFCKTAYGNYET